MEVCVFASGSSGNCLLVSDGGTRVLIDAGISLRRIEKALGSVGTSLSEIDGVLITHEHSDHISGLEMLGKYGSAPILAPRTVASRLLWRFPQLQEKLRVIPVEESFSLGELEIRAFHSSHDTDESVGYRIRGTGIYAHLTDTGVVTEEMLRYLRGADTVLLESNHDETMLRFGPYPMQLKNRILSDRGHLSNARCAETARSLAESGTRRIILGHLSKENNTPAKAMAETGQALLDTQTELFCAPVLGCLRVPVEPGEERPC